MTANKPETALYRAPIFPVLASHGGISLYVITSRIAEVTIIKTHLHVVS